MRQFALETAPGEPELRTVRDFGLSWSLLRDDGRLRRLVSRALSRHTLVLWRVEDVTWAGDGERREFTLPNGWTLAADGEPPVPSPGQDPARFEPLFRLEPSGAPLVSSRKEAGEFEAGEPAAGEVWWQRGTGRLKTGDVLADGAPLYGAVVPVYRVVVAAAAAELSLEKPLVEPFELRLLEDPS